MFIKGDVICSQKLTSVVRADRKLHKELSALHLGGRCEGQLAPEPLGDIEKKLRRP